MCHPATPWPSGYFAATANIHPESHPMPVWQATPTAGYGQPFYHQPFFQRPIYHQHLQRPAQTNPPHTAAASGQQPNPPFFSITHPGFLKGAVAGTAVAYLLSNENVQHAVIKTSVKAWMMLQGGVEELKERFKDAEAEIVAVETEEP